jgi:hypothetical protein
MVDNNFCARVDWLGLKAWSVGRPRWPARGQLLALVPRLAQLVEIHRQLVEQTVDRACVLNLAQHPTRPRPRASLF